jgi:hypothetical protein
MVYPEIAQEMNRLLRLDLDEAAGRLLIMAADLLKGRAEKYPVEAVMAIQARIRA